MKLVIAEKPSVAKSIADVLGADVARDGYMEGGEYLVSWCYGHLIELAQPDAYGDKYKKWTYDSLPILPQQWTYAIKTDTKSQFKLLKNLMSDQRVTSVVCATDAGREGELIFRLVYMAAGCRKPMERLWISSMEESAIRNGFRHLRPGHEYDRLYDAALCRQEADWLMGINGTRLLTVQYGGRKVLKMGRVQTPTLAMIVEREERIKNFTSQKSYAVHLKLPNIDAVSERFASIEEAERLMLECTGKKARVESVTKENKSIAPPRLYDLTSLQRDANRLFGFTAKETLEYTQSLYEKKLVTYPRTDSQYLSDDMADTARSVIEAVFQNGMSMRLPGYDPDINRLLDSSKVTDHHAVIPTVQVSKINIHSLPDGEQKVLLLAANRLICAAGEKHLYESVKVSISCAGHNFMATGKTVKQDGWKEYDQKFRSQFRKNKNVKEDEEDEKNLPEVNEGMEYSSVTCAISEHETTPPKRYTEDSLLSAMEHAGAEDMGDEVERKGLGTPATRADIIEKLVQDGFVERQKKILIPTDAGINLIAVVPDNVKSPKLTADWENSLALVAKGEFSRKDFMSGITAMVSSMVADAGNIPEEERQRLAALAGGEGAILGKCPKCGRDVVPGKFGAYCTGKCGMRLNSAMGKTLTTDQVAMLLSGKEIFLQNIQSSKGKSYDAYLYPIGTEDFTYKKDDGTEMNGTQFKFHLVFPKNKKKRKQ